CPAAHFARLARHERANAIARELALRLLIQALHLRHQSFKRLSDLVFAVGAELDFNRLVVYTEVKRGLVFIGQIGEGHIFVNLEMFHESVLQMTIVGKHALCAASPWCDCSFGTNSQPIEIQLGANGENKVAKPFEGLVPQMQRLYEQTQSEFTR